MQIRAMKNRFRGSRLLQKHEASTQIEPQASPIPVATVTVEWRRTAKNRFSDADRRGIVPHRTALTSEHRAAPTFLAANPITASRDQKEATKKVGNRGIPYCIRSLHS